ncbi:MAG: Sir2 family NAD-dependent protein deacetylase [Siculibacillus sp.]|nr:Sir2 family NAD-dependent protein deacetylase [Siculibacillus sp.]
MNIVRDPSEGSLLLADLIGASHRVVFFTGAGVSTESGIPDFRSPNGLWSKMKPIYYDEFVASEEARLEDWRRRFRFNREVAAAEPNRAHRAIAKLVAGGKVVAVITQNIDGLHQRSGVPSEHLVEIHGNATRAACLECEAHHDLAEVESEIARTGRAPMCRACGGLVKSAVVSFGQAMPVRAMMRAEYAIERADLFVAVGSSLQVQPAASLPMAAKYSGANLVIVNRDPTPLDAIADHVLRGSIGEVFSAI